MFVPYHCPTLDAILLHKILNQGCMDIHHVVTVFLVTEAGLLVSADGETEGHGAKKLPKSEGKNSE